MKVALLLGLLTVLSGELAEADGYSLLNAGITARNSDQSDDAIRFLSQAISAPDLPPGFSPSPISTAAESLSRERKTHLALADLNATIAARPDSFEAFELRAAIYRSMGKFDLQIADATSAIALRRIFRTPIIRARSPMRPAKIWTRRLRT